MNFLQIQLKSFKKNLLKIYILFLTNLLNKFKIKHSVITFPTKTKKLTLLKSPHVYKKAREQFKLCLYKKVIFIKNFNLLKFFNLLFLNKPKVINFIIKHKGK